MNYSLRKYGTRTIGSVRGMRDLLPEVKKKFMQIEQLAERLGEFRHYRPIETPIIEERALFDRSLGLDSDVVMKEMYTFPDKSGNHQLTLRPENTVGIMRSVLNHSNSLTLPQKFYYFGPMFRYERPQRGRYRQFQQVGFECIGMSDVITDIELIALGEKFLRTLGISAKVFTFPSY